MHTDNWFVNDNPKGKRITIEEVKRLPQGHWQIHNGNWYITKTKVRIDVLKFDTKFQALAYAASKGWVVIDA